MIEDRLCKNKAYFFCFESFSFSKYNWISNHQKLKLYDNTSVFDGCHFKQLNTPNTRLIYIDPVFGDCHFEQVNTAFVNFENLHVVFVGCHFK